MDWLIHPEIGVGNLKFGMSQEQVETLIGPPSGIRKMAEAFSDQSLKDLVGDQFVEYRDQDNIRSNSPSLTYNNRTLVEIEFYPGQDSLRLGDIFFFRTERKELIQQIIRIDPRAKANSDLFISPKIGAAMSMALYADENPTISFSAPGRELFLPDNMQPASNIVEN